MCHLQLLPWRVCLWRIGWRQNIPHFKIVAILGLGRWRLVLYHAHGSSGVREVGHVGLAIFKRLWSANVALYLFYPQHVGHYFLLYCIVCFILAQDSMALFCWVIFKQLFLGGPWNLLVVGERSRLALNGWEPRFDVYLLMVTFGTCRYLVEELRLVLGIPWESSVQWVIPEWLLSFVALLEYRLEKFHTLLDMLLVIVLWQTIVHLWVLNLL